MKESEKRLYLASQSPRRREILTGMGILFQVVPSAYVERLKQGVLPAVLALDHAEGKARRAVLPSKARWVMGADTVVACAGRILGKPRDEKDAIEMIQLLSGRHNEVVTGIALLDRTSGILTRAAAHSQVAIRKMNRAECVDYVRRSHPYDKAGGYAIQGHPRIARRVRGSYTNIVGFPRELVRRLLRQAGFLAGVLVLGLGLAQGFVFAAESAKVRSEHTEASLISEHTAFKPGTSSRIALRLRMDPKWHTYWKNSGDSGLATSLRWTLPEGFSAGPIEWPFPEVIRQDPLATYGYQGEVWLFSTLQVPEQAVSGSSVTIKVRADWLECEVPCLPGRAELTLELPVAFEIQQSSEWRSGAAAFLEKIPQAAPPSKLMFEQNGSGVLLRSLISAESAYFFPYDGELFDHAAAQKFRLEAAGFSLEIPRSKLKPESVHTLSGVLLLESKGEKAAYDVQLDEKTLLKKGPTVSLSPAAPSAPAIEKPLQIPNDERALPAVQTQGSPLSLAAALFFAFLGGIILNLMPCVLPVLSLKILGFVSQRGHPRELRSHALVWTLGVLSSFWLLSMVMMGLRWGGSSLGWGFHLQSPGMVAALTVIFLLLTLNMAGFFEVGLLLTRFAGSAAKFGEKNGQAFAAGFLAVVAATPCTAPFMGAALGYALAQPAPVILAVFTCLGLGLAFPFLLLAFVPGGLVLLPKPGPWMNTFKKILSVPLGLTVLWLLWVLAEQVERESLFQIAGVLAAASAAAIFYGREHLEALAGQKRALRMSRIYLGILVLLAVSAVALGVKARPASNTSPKSSEQGVEWRVYSPEEVDQLVRAGEPVFIDFTARWCLSCQVNDRLVFRTAEVAKVFKEAGVHAFMADWTSKDAGIAKALADYGRVSVPLYVWYDGQSAKPRFLPEVLTRETVIAAVTKDKKRLAS